MFTLSNNIATFVVDRTGVTGSSGVYTINYDSDLFNSTKKLLFEGYTVIFKVVLKNVTTKKDTDFRYFQAIHNNVSTKIYFLPDAELSSAGVFKFTLLDIPAQIKTNKSDIESLDGRVETLEDESGIESKVYYGVFSFTETIPSGSPGFVKSVQVNIEITGYKPYAIIQNQATLAVSTIVAYLNRYDAENPNVVWMRIYRMAATESNNDSTFTFTVLYKKVSDYIDITPE